MWDNGKKRCSGNCSRPKEKHHSFRCRHARPSQREPLDDWLVWLFSGGRGTGKTRAGAEWILDQVWNQGKKRIALVARTPADARDVMIFGDSGIMAVSGPHPRPEHEPTKRRLVWPNGAQAFTYSAAAPAQLRGPQHDAAWCDETAAWFDARKGDVLDTSWNNLMLGLRLGHHPQCFVTTTPKRVRLIRELMDRTSTSVTTDTTYANLMNLAPSFEEQVVSSYEGTRIGRQELMGELLTDVDGALWTLENIDDLRIKFDEEA
jgi:phage terminase large subunit-like protein